MKELSLATEQRKWSAQKRVMTPLSHEPSALFPPHWLHHPAINQQITIFRAVLNSTPKPLTAVYNTYLEVCTSFQKSCASIFIWTTGYYSHIHRTAIYTDVGLAYKTMHHIQDPIRMEISFYFLQKMRIPHKSPVRLITDPIIHCFVLTMLNIRPARNTIDVHSVDNVWLSEVPQQCQL